MKRPVPLVFTLLFIGLTAGVQTPPALSPGARLLFANVKSRLTVAEKNQLFQMSGLYVSNDKKHLVGDDDAKAKFPYFIKVYPTDLNQDGSEDVFIQYGNPTLSGNAGADVVLFTKNKAGSYQKNLGFPAAVPDVLTTTYLGYPDLLIGGPGFEYPVWRWNGTAYVLHRKVQNIDYEKTPKTGVKGASQAYQNTIN